MRLYRICIKFKFESTFLLFKAFATIIRLAANANIKRCFSSPHLPLNATNTISPCPPPGCGSMSRSRATITDVACLGTLHQGWPPLSLHSISVDISSGTGTAQVACPPATGRDGFRAACSLTRADSLGPVIWAPGRRRELELLKNALGTSVFQQGWPKAGCKNWYRDSMTSRCLSYLHGQYICRYLGWDSSSRYHKRTLDTVDNFGTCKQDFKRLKPQILASISYSGHWHIFPREPSRHIPEQKRKKCFSVLPCYPNAVNSAVLCWQLLRYVFEVWLVCKYKRRCPQQSCLLMDDR